MMGTFSNNPAVLAAFLQMQNNAGNPVNNMVLNNNNNNNGSSNRVLSNNRGSTMKTSVTGLTGGNGTAGRVMPGDQSAVASVAMMNAMNFSCPAQGCFYQNSNLAELNTHRLQKHGTG